MLQWQEGWAYNKYWVMAHSQQCYEQIRRLAKNNEWSDQKAAAFHRLLDTAAHQAPTTQTLTNTYQHVWVILRKSAPRKKNKLIYTYYKHYPHKLMI